MALPKTPEPKGNGNYFKPEKDSTTTLRVLSDFMEFDLAWLAKKPIRKPVNSKWERSEYDAPSADGKFKNEPRMAWACEVYNYADGKHQVWEIPQKSIRDELRVLDNSKHWGDLKDYDIEITRTDGDKVTYKVMGVPNTKEIPTEVQDAYNEVHVFDGFWLPELMVGGDPYKPVGDPKYRVDPTIVTGGIEPNVVAPARRAPQAAPQLSINDRETPPVDDDIPF